ncbi:MAG: hypothetical protein NC131_10530 [Roseburia sp.]|nr:hypothetical protein [Roseburia sp.]
MDRVYLAVYTEGFIKNPDLKAKFAEEFRKRKMSITAKASLIEQCNLYRVDKVQKRIDGKVVSGYEMHKSQFTFNL